MILVCNFFRAIRQSILMYFVRSWKTGLIAIYNATWLSQYNSSAKSMQCNAMQFLDPLLLNPTQSQACCATPIAPNLVQTKPTRILTQWPAPRPNDPKANPKPNLHVQCAHQPPLVTARSWLASSVWLCSGSTYVSNSNGLVTQFLTCSTILVPFLIIFYPIRVNFGIFKIFWDEYSHNLANFKYTKIN